MDEVAAAYSVTFDPAGERLFAGLDGCISVFDVSRPGRQVETRKMKGAVLGYIGRYQGTELTESFAGIMKCLHILNIDIPLCLSFFNDRNCNVQQARIAAEFRTLTYVFFIRN